MVDARGGTFIEIYRDQIISNCDNYMMPFNYSNPGLHNLLDPVHEAEYTRKNVARCLSHTREGIISEIERLVDKGDVRIC
jgi:hypothetical protein